MNIRLKNQRMNFFVRIFWLYLVTIHRFFYKFIKWESDKSMMTVVTFALTVFGFYAWFDSYFENPIITSRSSGYGVGIVLFIITLPISFWYNYNHPTKI